MSRKGQEEIVGFVAVIVLVIIVLVVFLSISLQTGDGSGRDSMRLQQFMEGSLEYTSSCVHQSRATSLRSLLDICRQTAQCDDGRESCAVLKETVSQLVTYGLRVGPGQPFTGYTFVALYETGENQEQIAVQSEGDCSSFKEEGVSEVTPSEGGTISVSLKVC